MKSFGLTPTVILIFNILISNTSSGLDVNSNKSMNKKNSLVKFDIWDVQLAINLTEGTGAEFDGTFFYITNGPSNLIRKYDRNGILIETFSIPGVNNLNDIAFDGTYMYGSSGSQTIYQMDFINKVVVGTITSPINVRHIAYDESNDAFWVGSWTDPLALISRTGAVLNIFSILLPTITGTAYDNLSPGGPYLWIFERGDTIPGPQLIRQFHISSGMFTGVTHDVLSDVGVGQPDAVAGGLFSTPDLVQNTFSLGGILIGNPTILFAYEVHNVIPVELTEFTAELIDGKVVLKWETATELNNEGFEIQRKQKKLNNDWQMIGFVKGNGTSTEVISYSFEDSQVETGSYFYRLKQIDFDGSFSFSKETELHIAPPENYILNQNFPNPFNPVTRIKFIIPSLGTSFMRFVQLKVYDVLGTEVTTLVSEELSAGEYDAELNAKGLKSGVYFYQLRVGEFSLTKKMILLK